MPVKALHYLDLAVADVERSVQFYLALLGPLGVAELYRFPTYRGSEEVVYLGIGPGKQAIGFRRADGGAHRYYEVGVEHIAISVDRRDEVDAVYDRAVEMGARIHFPVEEDRDIPGYWALKAEAVGIERVSLARRGRVGTAVGRRPNLVQSPPALLSGQRTKRGTARR